MLESELHALHRDLRTVAKAYVSRLENDLLVCIAALGSHGPIEQLPRELLHEIRRMLAMTREARRRPAKVELRSGAHAQPHSKRTA